MGTKMAPNYAIICMDYIETKLLASHILNPLVWWRYIDDIFFIWSHSREEVTSFSRRLNEFHPTIKFTLEISDTHVDFLGTTVFKNPHGTLGSTIYHKPTIVPSCICTIAAAILNIRKTTYHIPKSCASEKYAARMKILKQNARV